jgi:hypothetical protein
MALVTQPAGRRRVLAPNRFYDTVGGGIVPIVTFGAPPQSFLYVDRANASRSAGYTGGACCQIKSFSADSRNCLFLITTWSVQSLRKIGLAGEPRRDSDV